MSQPAEPETNSEEQSTLPVKTEEGTILLTPEEIRAALDAGTLDASNIDTACLTDENGLLSWLWSLLFGKRDDDSSTRLRPRSIPAGAPWAARPTIMTSTPTSRSRASSPSTTSSITSTPTVSAGRHLRHRCLQISVEHRLGAGQDGGRQVRHHPHRLPRLRQRRAGAGPHV